MKQPAVYIAANKPHGTLYIGVTSNLAKRLYEHKTHAVEGFTNKYDIGLLVWYELHETMESAIVREKVLKRWNRAWKIELIEKENIEWHDLYEEIIF